jgi:hypothetical protein
MAQQKPVVGIVERRFFGFERHRFEKERVFENARQDWLTVFEEHNESFMELP